MFVYLLYMISPILLSLFYNNDLQGNPNTKKRFLKVYALIMCLMIGLRNLHNGSTDSMIYYRYWTTIGNIPFSGIPNMLKSIDLEYGYLLSAWLLSHVFPDPQFQFFISGIVFSCSVCYFVYKNSEDIPLSLLMFNCLGLFNFFVQGLRQSIAMCICLFAIEQCKKRKMISFILLVLLASLFHGSALIFVFVYFLFPLKVDFKTCAILAVLSAFGSRLINQALDFMNYAMNENYSLSGNMEAQGGIVAALVYILILALELLRLWNKNREQKYSFFFYYTLVGAVAFIMRGAVGPIIDRISMYFMFGQMILLPDGMNIFSKNSNTLVRWVVVALCVGIAIYKTSYSTLIPYNFFWDSP